MKPKYSIVKVDDRCPVEEEEDIDLIDRIKMFPCFNDKRLSCKKCRYGDTKEQLVMKVAQALKRARIEEDENSKSLSWEQIATRIVEFLGVEE